MRKALLTVPIVLAACSSSPFLPVDELAPDASPDAAMDAVDAPTDTARDGSPRVDGDPPDADAGELDAGDAGTDGPLDVAMPDAGDGCVVATHDDGLGEGWQDCTPVLTYTLAEAERACVAHTGNASYCAPMQGGVSYAVCSSAGGWPTCACWEYQGTHVGLVNHGQDGCEFPGTGLGTDSSWQ